MGTRLDFSYKGDSAKNKVNFPLDFKNLFLKFTKCQETQDDLHM